MYSRRRYARPRLELLEGRDVPANLTVTFAPLTRTLTVVGDADNNSLTVRGEATDPTLLMLSSGADTINGLSNTVLIQDGVRNVSIRLLGGNDDVIFGDAASPVHLAGSLTVNGGDGANFFQAINLAVDGNVSIANGAVPAGRDYTELFNLSAGGNVTVRNASGRTVTEFIRRSNGNSEIGGNLIITNGTGVDAVGLFDTDVGGNVTVNNGHGESGNTGGVVILNNVLTGRRSVIKGNLTVTYLDGAGLDQLMDAEVRGNVTFNDGPGRVQTVIDAFNTSAPVLVRGNLTITGTGTNEVDIGSPPFPGVGHGVGLIVGHNLTVASGAGNDILNLNQLQVGGATRLALGDGNNAVTIDDSLFAGTFALATGSGNDSLDIETAVGTAHPTEFDQAAVVSLGAGTDAVRATRISSLVVPLAGQEMVVLGTFVIKGQESFLGSDQIVFPFGGEIQFE